MNWNLILTGIAGSLIAGLTSWFKNASADGKVEAYEVKYLVPTLVAGAASGAIAHIPGIPESWKLAVAAGGPVLIQNLLKGLTRHGGGLGAVLGSLIGDLKNPDATPAK